MRSTPVPAGTARVILTSLEAPSEPLRVSRRSRRSQIAWVSSFFFWLAMTRSKSASLSASVGGASAGGGSCAGKAAVETDKQAAKRMDVPGRIMDNSEAPSVARDWIPGWWGLLPGGFAGALENWSVASRERPFRANKPCKHEARKKLGLGFFRPILLSFFGPGRNDAV